MEDKSYLDKKYFIDENVYNCPFCNRNNVMYTIHRVSYFNWSEERDCWVYLAKCTSCKKISMHLSSELISDSRTISGHIYYEFKNDIDIDSKIFYSVPTSFFVIDSRINRIFRELISEAEGCLKMNYLTGASACTRKAIYEFTVLEKAKGSDYESKIKFLKDKYKNIKSEYFDILCQIKDMTSDKIHEQSWDKWDSDHLKLFIETLKTMLYEIYVYPREMDERFKKISKLKPEISKKNIKD